MDKKDKKISEKEFMEKVVDTFINSLDMKEDYTLRELKHFITGAFNMHYHIPKKINNEDKKKREPTEYNKFVSSKMAQLKEEQPTMSARERMKEVGKLWREHKSSNKMDEDVD